MSSLKTEAQLTSFEDSVNRIYQRDMRNFWILLRDMDATQKQKSNLLFDSIYHFIQLHPKNIYASQLIQWGKWFDSTQIITLHKMLDPSLQRQTASLILNQIVRARLQPGTAFPAVNLHDSLAKNVSISDYKGKITLLNTWASWCGPCRAEMPHLKKIYQQYEGKGFTVLNISLDDNRDKWLKAVAHDKQPWPQFCDLKIWRNNIFFRQLAIDNIPYNFLLDESGKVIDKELTITELESALAKLLP